jgi:ATP-dependent DNA helicase RecG
MNLTPTAAIDNAALVQQLITTRESRHLEFKRVSGKMVGKALETVCALANTDGGTLVLGVADLKEFKGDARLFGVEENPEAVDELRRKLLTEFSPAISTVRMVAVSCRLHNGPAKGQNGHLLLMHVGRSSHVHSILNSGTFTRMEAGNRPMSAAESTELLYRRGARSASSEPVAVALDRLQTTAWKRFAEAARYPVALQTSFCALVLLKRWTAWFIRGEPPCCCFRTSQVACWRLLTAVPMCV